MKVAFNIDYDHLRYTGIGRYGLELISAWAALNQDCELWMWRNTKSTPPRIPGVKGKIRYYPFPQRITNHIIPGIWAKLSGLHWVHTANGILLPRVRGLKQANMVHDLGPILYGHMKHEDDTIVWKERLRRIAERSDCILVNSLSTMHDLTEVFPAIEGKVFLTPLGIDHFSSHGERSGHPEHILAVGTVEPRKNIDGLLRAYSALSARRETPPLVIAGGDGFRAEEYRHLSLELGLSDRVTFTGFVSDSQLAYLYSRAFCLVHPAHHEGFGFTVPEAFTWKLPVAASNTGGLGEFFSEAAWMMDPSDNDSILHGIEMALDRGVTPEQEERRKILAEQLTWENCARETLRALTLSDG
jgi:glycosyltransferase involved in cell wall biosynthesis